MLPGHNHPVSKLKRNQEEESFGVRRLHKKEAGMKAKKDKGGAGFPGTHTLPRGHASFSKGYLAPRADSRT